MPELPAILTTGGVFGVLAFVIVYLIGGNLKDRRDYREAYTGLVERLNKANEREAATQIKYDELLKAKRDSEELLIQKNRELQQEIFLLRQGGGSGGAPPT